MKVAFDARHLHAAPVLRGMDRYTVELVAALVRRGVQVTLFHRAREPLNLAHVADLGCAVAGLPDWSGRHWEQVAVPRALWQGRFDLYHAPAERGVPWFAPCPVVLTVHSVTSESYLDLVRRGCLPGPVRNYLGYSVRPHARTFNAMCESFGIARADFILTPSEFARREVIRFLQVPARRVLATPLAIPAPFHEPPHTEALRNATLQRLGIQPPYLLCVGGYEPHKNVEGLLRTFARVRQKHPDLTLVIVGSKSLPEQTRNAAARLGLQKHAVVFLVNITKELLDLYDSADLFVTLSWRETFCLPALEAMTRGLPVVASRWGAAPEVVGDCGRLVDPRDLEAAAAAILACLDRSERAALSERARARALGFRWEHTAEQTHRIYARLLAERSASWWPFRRRSD